MIKKIFLIILFSVIIISCGKKGDPIYNDPKNKAEKLSTKINTVS